MTSARLRLLKTAILTSGKGLGMVPGETRSDCDPRLAARGLPQHDWHKLIMAINSTIGTVDILERHFGAVTNAPTKYQDEFKGDLADLMDLKACYTRKLNRALGN